MAGYIDSSRAKKKKKKKAFFYCVKNNEVENPIDKPNKISLHDTMIKSF